MPACNPTRSGVSGTWLTCPDVISTAIPVMPAAGSAHPDQRRQQIPAGHMTSRRPSDATR